MARRAATTLALATLATAFAPMPATARSAPMRAAFYDLADVANDGSEVAFSQFEGKKADLGRASWQAMQAEAGADAPAWNFKGKFLVSRDGAVTDASGVDDIAAAVKALL
ncbi:glutathione peroxidase [Aureococcus anophagefferens]|nr:glutathione peroxidase [Aureococcus anophagefferens]